MFMFSYSYSCSVLYPDRGVSVFFLSSKANATVNLANPGHGTDSSLIVFFHDLIVLFYVLICVQRVFKYSLCVNVYCTTATGC